MKSSSLLKCFTEISIKLNFVPIHTLIFTYFILYTYLIFLIYLCVYIMIQVSKKSNKVETTIQNTIQSFFDISVFSVWQCMVVVVSILLIIASQIQPLYCDFLTLRIIRLCIHCTFCEPRRYKNSSVDLLFRSTFI